MAIQWKEPDAKDRLLAAVIAASSNVRSPALDNNQALKKY